MSDPRDDLRTDAAPESDAPGPGGEAVRPTAAATYNSQAASAVLSRGASARPDGS